MDPNLVYIHLFYYVLYTSFSSFLHSVHPSFLPFSPPSLCPTSSFPLCASLTVYVLCSSATVLVCFMAICCKECFGEWKTKSQSCFRANFKECDKVLPENGNTNITGFKKQVWENLEPNCDICKKNLPDN